eukprot:TRINITY_DN25378_c0_g1_i1.p1 TRINITY_DN25378_c0_g1~~TRINITY_DN25378_c0_g1_i1.p1  ORF type:complete len:582 (+),score=131.42 TRINITY_DN25378_c0_g1_i1:47-1792(+)
MASSRGDADGSEGTLGSGDEEIQKARAAVRQLLNAVHVIDVLPDRSHMLAVDAKLPVHSVLTAVLSEQHPRLPRRSGALQQGVSQDGGGGGSGGGGGGGGYPGAEMRREASQMASTTLPEEEEEEELCCGLVSPSLPTNVLAEVCEIDAVQLGRPGDAAGVSDTLDDKTPTMRRWTSPDDGWGMTAHVIPSDLEKMPLGMPVTVGELADFLAHACEPEDQSDESMLDWSLSQWRTHRLKLGSKAKQDQPKDEKRQDGEEEEEEETSRLELLEASSLCGPVLVHRVPSAPARPVLCADDPEATLLKAVQLLLAYPSCDALPIVSPVRCTVVAHLTLSSCLAFMLSRLRGTELTPLADLKVGSESDASQRKFQASKVPTRSVSDAEDSMQTGAAEEKPAPWVLCKSQPLRELLAFFARTHHSLVPVVEDDAGGGVLGILSRRDLLCYLDLAMQSTRKQADEGGQSDIVVFDIAAPVEGVMKAVRRCGQSLPQEEESGKQQAEAKFSGASLVYEEEVTVKSLVLQILNAENRKVLFVQDAGSGLPPRLRRILSAGDVWRLLIGTEREALASEFQGEHVTTSVSM